MDFRTFFLRFQLSNPWCDFVCFFSPLRPYKPTMSDCVSSQARACVSAGETYYQTYVHHNMDESMKQFQQILTEVETEAENLLLARQQLVENDRLRNGNREALTALRRRARTTKTSVPSSAFESLMKEIEGPPLVKEVCATCGNHDSKEKTWMMFPGTGVFARIPFHASHSILEKDQEQLDFNAKKLQSYVKEKSLWISEKGLLADKISPGVLKSMVTLTDNSK